MKEGREHYYQNVFGVCRERCECEGPDGCAYCEFTGYSEYRTDMAFRWERGESLASFIERAEGYVKHLRWLKAELRRVCKEHAAVEGAMRVYSERIEDRRRVLGALAQNGQAKRWAAYLSSEVSDMRGLGHALNSLVHYRAYLLQDLTTARARFIAGENVRRPTARSVRESRRAGR